MSEIASFYGFTVSMDNDFKGEPSVLIDYREDNISDRYDLETGKFVNGAFSQTMIRILTEWIDDHIQILKAMWAEKKIAVLPDWE